MKKTKQRKKQTYDGSAVSPWGGLEDLTQEEIDENIRKYPYVLGKLKDC